MQDTPEVPAGFEPLQRGGPYFQALGPIYARHDGDDLVLGLRIAPSHLNVQGVAHGGMLATVADGALGIAIARARGARLGQVTVSMTLDYLSSAREGQWIEAPVRVTRVGQRLAFAEVELRNERGTVLRGSGVFAFVER